MIELNRPLILASQSPRRKKLLKQIGLKFRVVPSSVDEIFVSNISPSENARLLAVKKAEDIARRIRRGIVIGADTIVVRDHHLLGKPTTAREAVQMLQLLSEKSHYVYTGIALVDAQTKKKISTVEKTEVHFRKIDLKEIKSYVASGSPMDKAGAYGIQDDYGAVFVERINGCYYNVVGLPLARFYTLLQEFTKLLNGD